MLSTTPGQRALLTAGSVVVDFGAELLDENDVVVADLSPDLVDGDVLYDGRAKQVHRSCSVDLLRALDWAGRPRVRLWQSVSDGGVERVEDVVEALDATNLLANPSAEYGAANTGWRYFVRCSASPDTSWAASGTTSLRVTVTDTAAAPYVYMGSGPESQSPRVDRAGPVAPGDYVSTLVTMKALRWCQVRFDAQGYNAAGGSVGTMKRGGYVSVAAGEVVTLRVEDAFAAHPDTACMLPILYFFDENANQAPLGDVALVDVCTVINHGSTPSDAPLVYFDGDTPDTVEYSYRWDGTPHASTSSRYRRLVSTREVEQADRYNLGVFVLTTPDERVGEGPDLAEPAVVEEVTEALDARNLATNGSFEVDVSGWANVSPNTMLTRSTEWAEHGSASMLVEAADEVGAGVRQSVFTPVSPGQVLPYRVAVRGRTGIGTHSVQIGLNSQSGARVDNVLIPLADAPQEVVRTYTVPTDGSVTSVRMQVQRAQAGLHSYWLDGISLGAADHFDGDTPDTVEYSYRWDGPPHASTSSRYRRLTSTRVLPAVDARAGYTVEGYDKLHLLQHNVPDTYVIPTGTGYLDAARQALADAGYTGLPPLFDGAAQTKTLTEPMVWVLDLTDPHTWLGVINDILAKIAYVPLWADQDGRYRSHPIVPAETRAPEWTFDLADPDVNIAGQDRTLTRDSFEDVNWWRFVRDDMNVLPVEGDGVYTVDLRPDPSVPRRPAFATVTAADQEALVAQGNQAVAEATRRTRSITATCGPLPILGHDDVVTWADPVLGTSKAQIVAWKQTLSGEQPVDLDLEVIG